MKQRFAVILFADVVNYTQMMGEDQDVAISFIKELRDTHLEPCVGHFNGEVLKRLGDGWIIAFNSGADAVSCATQVQSDLSDHPKLRLRIGIHMGDIVEDEDDLYGTGVNLTARLQAEAPPGGIMITSDLLHQLPAKQSELFSDAGPLKLKNITHRVNGYQWRPAKFLQDQRAESIPVISVERFEAAPDTSENQAAAADLREQFVLATSKRTGVKVRDAELGDANAGTYLIRGRFRNAGTLGRLNLTLVLCEDGSAVWSGVFDGDTSDLFAFCDDVALRAEAEVRQQFNALDGERISELADDVLSISELRTRAATYFYTSTIQGWERALELMDRAVRLNPDDPMATAMRTEAIYFLNLVNHVEMDIEDVEQLSSDLNQAFEALPRSDYVHFARANLRTHLLKDADGALADVKRCLKINSGYLPIFEAEGSALMRAGRFEDSVSSYKKAVEGLPNDPLVQFRAYYLAIAQFCAGQFQDALSTVSELANSWPDVRAYRLLLACVHRELGDEESAKQEEVNAQNLSICVKCGLVLSA